METHNLVDTGGIEMSATIRITVPATIATIIGAILIITYFAPPVDALTSFKSTVTTWAVIISSFSIILGAVYFLRYNVRKVSRGLTTRAAFYSLVSLAAFCVFIIVGLSFPGLQASDQYTMLFMNSLTPIGASVFGICFFYCISSAYRAFKIASWEAIGLLVAGVIYMLRQLPVGPALWPPILPLGEWFLNYPNVGATRGAIIAAAFGAMVVGIRTLLQKEAGVMVVGGEEE